MQVQPTVGAIVTHPSTQGHRFIYNAPINYCSDYQAGKRVKMQSLVVRMTVTIP